MQKLMDRMDKVTGLFCGVIDTTKHENEAYWYSGLRGDFASLDQEDRNRLADGVRPIQYFKTKEEVKAIFARCARTSFRTPPR